MFAYALVKDSEGFCLYIILIRSSFGGGGGVFVFLILLFEKSLFAIKFLVSLLCMQRAILELKTFSLLLCY